MNRREVVAGAAALALTPIIGKAEEQEFPGVFYFIGDASDMNTRMETLFTGMRLTRFFGKVGVDQFWNEESPSHVVAIHIPEGYTHDQWIAAREYCDGCSQWKIWSKTKPTGEFVNYLMNRVY